MRTTEINLPLHNRVRILAKRGRKGGQNGGNGPPINGVLGGNGGLGGDLYCTQLPPGTEFAPGSFSKVYSTLGGAGMPLVTDFIAAEQWPTDSEMDSGADHPTALVYTATPTLLHRHQQSADLGDGSMSVRCLSPICLSGGGQGEAVAVSSTGALFRTSPFAQYAFSQVAGSRADTSNWLEQQQEMLGRAPEVCCHYLFLHLPYTCHGS